MKRFLSIFFIATIINTPIAISHKAEVLPFGHKLEKNKEVSPLEGFTEEELWRMRGINCWF